MKSILEDHVSELFILCFFLSSCNPISLAHILIVDSNSALSGWDGQAFFSLVLESGVGILQVVRLDKVASGLMSQWCKDKLSTASWGQESQHSHPLPSQSSTSAPSLYSMWPVAHRRLGLGKPVRFYPRTST